MQLYRSFLFVPGHRAEWIAKAPKYGADALLLDLEDACPVEYKVAARETVRNGIADLAARNVAAFVRINATDTGLSSGDLEAIVSPGLKGVMIPKLETVTQIIQLDAWMEHFERKAGMDIGAVKIYGIPETALGLKDAYALASALPRVACVINAAGARAGDVNKALGNRWTQEGRETEYVLQHILLANRAAGVEYPITAGNLDVTDQSLARIQMGKLRNIGYRGMLVIHPSAVPIANEVFSPSREEIEWQRGVVIAMAEAVEKGLSAVTYDGMMIDYAHVRNALDLLAQARAFGMEVGDVPAMELMSFK